MGKHQPPTDDAQRAHDVLLERARNLFEFLARVQQVRASPVRTTDTYARDGSVIWLSSLPEHSAITSGHRGRPEVGDPLITVDRVPRVDPPEPDASLRPWVHGELDQPDRAPTMRETVPASMIPDLAPPPAVPNLDDAEDTTTAGASGSRTITVDAGSGDQADRYELDGTGSPDVEKIVRARDCPEIVEAFEAWLGLWQTWAAAERQDAAVRAMYTQLFSIFVTITGHSEDFELALGTGCLAWDPANHPPVRRHLLTVPARIEFDDDSGRLTVVRDESYEPVTVELDMLDPGIIASPQRIKEIKEQAEQFSAHPLDRAAVGPLARRIVNTLDPDAHYSDDDEAPTIAATPAAAFAPALIMRKRSQQGMLNVFRTIVTQLKSIDEVPSGLLPLVDPDYEPPAERDATPGGIVDVDDEPFLPMPVNEQQLKIIRAVDARAQTVVQGPPGTGKTHTAAALLSHLLAQGKRVLVTAHTDRALKEVRDKLPEGIKPLSVAVVGTSRSDLTDLKVAVDRLSSEAAERGPDSFRTEEAACLRRIDELQRQRAVIYQQLVEAREQEVTERSLGVYRGTLAAIAQAYRADSKMYHWLTELIEVVADSMPPLSNDGIGEFLQLLRDRELRDDEPASQCRLTELTDLPEPDSFATLCCAESAAAEDVRRYSNLLQHPEWDAVSNLTPQDRSGLQWRMRAIADHAEQLERRHETWMVQAVHDVCAHRGMLWRNRAQQIQDLITQVTPLVDWLGTLTQVTIDPDTDVPGLISLARGLQQYLHGGGHIKIAPDGRPKVGLMAHRAVKDAARLFEHVRVNGHPPATDQGVTAFLAFTQGQSILAALDRAWPSDVVVSDDDTLNERLQWHITEAAQLQQVLELGNELAATERWLATAKLRVPDWNDLATVRTYARMVDAAIAVDTQTAASRPLVSLAERVDAVARGDDAAAVVQELSYAVNARDATAYERAHTRLVRLHTVRDMAARRAYLAESLAATPGLRQSLEATYEDPVWNTRLAAFDAAWSWASTGARIRQRQAADVNALQVQISRHENQIRGEVEKLAASRAWSHAVSPGRLTGQARADLTQYAQLVRRLGRGTGRYVVEQRAEIRRAMDRCRPAVPVWIMPIYRIAEQLTIRENMFDVVVVDEASQAGMDATFLQYLAPKIVVIGDDKQVSPSAVGVDQQQLRDMANQYIADERYKDSWQDPTRSLFDEAAMRYRGKITLVEHRRCVPEIIGFSNRIAYEPEGVRLIPVRQYGADRLDPIKAVHVPNGYERGQTSIVNPAEVDAIADQIEKCLADQRYDGCTFGVISLLGSAQAKAIETELLRRVPPDEWTARDLRCGDAADFQGSERDVMFLSMVAAPTPGRRLGALTRNLYVQRYNVAASRAKDQLWVFHSVTLDDLRNKDDMRFALLDYCYGVINRATSNGDRIGTKAVPEDARVEPFDSLFEQRVFNRLFDRGLSVVPQFPALGYLIDLVIVGRTQRLAVECDGDFWHGPSAYQADLARQRDLERCGWQFFRIGESAFYVDEAAVLEELWRKLDELDIHPSGWSSDASDDRTDHPGTGVIEQDNHEDMVDGAVCQGCDGDSAEGQRTADSGGQAVESTLSPRGQMETTETTGVPSAQATRYLGRTMGFVTARERTSVGANIVSHLADAGTVARTTSDGADDHQRSTDQPGRDSAALSSGGLHAYTAFAGALTPADVATGAQLSDGVIAIVTVEGPICGSRLQSVYVKASGGQRVGRKIAGTLNAAISAAVRRGALIVDNPLHEAGVKPRTYRLPSQPGTLLRELGPRSLEEVPPSELASHMAEAAADTGWEDTDALFHAVLERFDRRRLTASADARLRSVIPLVRDREP